MKKTSVLLADDHTLIRAGLRLVVDAQPDLAVVGEASDGREAVAEINTAVHRQQQINWSGGCVRFESAITFRTDHHRRPG